jgi:predicted RNase H-like HicB family nuclease
MKSKKLRFDVFFESGWYTASCLDAFIVTQGKTFKVLEMNIREAVELHFADEIKKKLFNPVISLKYVLSANA